MAEITLTTENFESEVLNSDIPVVVDFWATWCGPCRTIGPILSSFAENSQGKVKVGKVDVDAQEDLAAKYKVMSIPTIIVFKNGEIAAKAVGVQTVEKLAEMAGI